MTPIATSYLNAQLTRLPPEQVRLHRLHRMACEREELLKEFIALRQGDVEAHFVELHTLRASKSKIAQKIFLQERFAA